MPKWVPRSLIRCRVLLDNGSRHTLLTRIRTVYGTDFCCGSVHATYSTHELRCLKLTWRAGEGSPWLHSPSFASNLKHVTNVYTLFDVACSTTASRDTPVQLVSTTDVATAHIDILSAQLHQPGRVTSRGMRPSSLAVMWEAQHRS